MEQPMHIFLILGQLDCRFRVQESGSPSIAKFSVVCLTSPEVAGPLSVQIKRTCGSSTCFFRDFHYLSDPSIYGFCSVSFTSLPRQSRLFNTTLTAPADHNCIQASQFVDKSLSLVQFPVKGVTSCVDMTPGAVTANMPEVTSSVSLLKEVPRRYLWGQDLRDARFTREESFQSKGVLDTSKDEDLPIIDLSGLSIATNSERKELAKAIGSAAQHWGFFQVINHGVSGAVINEMDAHGKHFFSNVPLEAKERAVETDPAKHTYYHGYGGRFQHLKARVPWLEYLGECYSPVNGAEGLLNKVWPGVGNPVFCDAVAEYCKSMSRLGREILALLAESIDLSPDFFSQHFSESSGYQAHWRFNHYPACPEPSKTLGLGPHTDPCGITIVKQDDVGGFQLRKRGYWYDVQPLAGSFLVNIGDCLQAWTNGRFKSVIHRALVNSQEDRLSIVFPFSPAADCKFSVPLSLVDDSHPLAYPDPIEWHHLAVLKGNNVAKEALSSNFGLKVVSSFNQQTINQSN